MSQLADQNKHEHLEGVPTTAGHRALSVLTRVTLVALLDAAASVLLHPSWF